MTEYALVISDESRLDILDAVSWYEMRKSGFWKDFEIRLEAGFKQILKDPNLFIIYLTAKR